MIPAPNAVEMEKFLAKAVVVQETTRLSTTELCKGTGPRVLVVMDAAQSPARSAAVPAKWPFSGIRRTWSLTRRPASPAARALVMSLTM